MMKAPSKVSHANRLKRIRASLKLHKLDAIVLTHPSDLWWASGFSGHDSIGIVTARELIIVSDFRYDQQLKREAGHVTVVMRKSNMLKALPETIAARKLKRVGFESQYTTFSIAHAISLKAEAVSLDNLLVNLRSIKDMSEIKTIRKAIEIAQEGLRATLPTIRIGQTESEVAARLVYEMTLRGASGPSFAPIIAVGANSALPHYRAGSTRVANGQTLLIDWGCVYDGYCSDLTRTFFIGDVNPKMIKIYDIVLKAQKAAIARIRAGMTNLQADAVARKIITTAGFGKEFGHGTGHGMGMDIHEEPRLNPLFASRMLEKGQVVTIEPGIYLPGIGGVRIEDDVLLQESGCEILTDFDKSRRSAQNTIKVTD